MRDFLDQIERAVQQDGLYFVALGAGLAVPDICGALVAPNGRATRERYVAWVDENVAPAYAGNLTGEDCWGLRCAYLHQGSMKPHGGAYERVLFVEPGAMGGSVFHNNVLNDALNIDIRVFVEQIVAAAHQWLSGVENTETFQKNLSDSMRRHPSGLRPYIVGVPVIG